MEGLRWTGYNTVLHTRHQCHREPGGWWEGGHRPPPPPPPPPTRRHSVAGFQVICTGAAAQLPPRGSARSPAGAPCSPGPGLHGAPPGEGCRLHGDKATCVWIYRLQMMHGVHLEHTLLSPLPSDSSRSSSAKWSLTSLGRADRSIPRSAITGVSRGDWVVVVQVMMTRGLNSPDEY